MRIFLTVLSVSFLLAACAPQERIYDITEIDEPPILVGDSLIIEAPAPVDPEDHY